MAIAQTPNLGLNQWVETDPVRREDFNRDNLKIDNAIASGFSTVKAISLVTTEAVQQLDIDTSHIALKDYAYMLISGSIKTSYANVTGVVMRINNTSNPAYHVQTGSNSSSNNYNMAIFANAFYDMYGEIKIAIINDRPICQFTYFGAHDSATTTTLGSVHIATQSRVNCLNFLVTNGSDILPGSEIYVNYIRK